MNLYEKVLSIAKEAHKGQKDKAGRDYIEHLIFVASLVNSEEEKAVALLHDIVEDTAMTLEELKGLGIPAEIVEAVSILTKKPKSSYFSYIETVKTNQLAKVVKLADLSHNSDLSRIPNPTEKDYERTRKYQRAISFLKDKEFASFQEYDNRMSQLAIMVRKLTDDLNKIVEKIEYKNDVDVWEDDDKMTLLFSAGVILEIISHLIKGHPIAVYDSKTKQPYLLYPDGRREYKNKDDII